MRRLETPRESRRVSNMLSILLVSFAAALGRAPNLDTPVPRVYAHLSPPWSNDSDRITFRHLLTMSSGLNWEEWGRGIFSSDETRLFWKSEPERFVLERPLSFPPGSRFNYNGGGTTVLASPLARQPEKTLLEIAQEDLCRNSDHDPASGRTSTSNGTSRVSTHER